MNTIAISPTRASRTAAVLLAAVFMLASVFMAAAPVEAKRPDRVDFWLTVLHNNDGESKLLEALAERLAPSTT